MQIARRCYIAAIATAAALCWLLSPVQAQTFPSKPLRLIIGFSAGGSSDILARLLAQGLTERLGQQVIVENRLGASGIISADVVVKSPPDGYTLLLGVPGPIITSPALGMKLPYDPIKDLVPVVLVAHTPMAFVVSSTVPVDNLQELIAYAKANPGKLNYASTGAGSMTHLSMEMLKHAAGVDIRHVPYKGAVSAIPDLIAGNVQMMMDAGWDNTLPHVKTGKLKYMGVSSIKRSSAQPQVPTIAEGGFPGFDASPWYGVFAPAGIPAGVRTRLAKEVAAVVESPSVRKRFADLGFEPMTGDGAVFSNFILSERVRWVKIIHDGNIKLE